MQKVFIGSGALSMTKKQYIHKAIVFNMANPQHKKVYEWLLSETSNISGFIFQTLVMRYEGFRASSPAKLEDDKDLMRGMI